MYVQCPRFPPSFCLFHLLHYETVGRLPPFKLTAGSELVWAWAMWILAWANPTLLIWTMDLIFKSIFLYLSYVIPCIFSFIIWKQWLCHVHVCVRRDKSCKNTCGNFTRLWCRHETTTCYTPGIYANLATCTLLSGEFFLHYKLLYRLPNSGTMHSFRDDLVAMLAFFTVILREWYEQLVNHFSLIKA